MFVVLRSWAGRTRRGSISKFEPAFFAQVRLSILESSTEILTLIR